jgi:hypothetical protein
MDFPPVPQMKYIWSKAVPCRPKDTLRLFEACPSGKSKFKKLNQTPCDPNNMNYLLGNEYNRLWQQQLLDSKKEMKNQRFGTQLPKTMRTRDHCLVNTCGKKGLDAPSKFDQKERFIMKK